MSVTIELQTQEVTFPRVAWGAILCSGTAAVAGHFFHIVQPLTGAVYGAAFAVPVSEFLNHWLGKDLLEKVLKLVLQFFGQAFFAFAAAKALGYGMTFPASLTLGVITAAAIILTRAVLTTLKNSSVAI